MKKHLIIFICALCLAPCAFAQILFQTSFEGSNPFQGLQDNQSCCSYSTTASTAFAFDGSQSYRAEVRAGDPSVSSGYRAELTGFPSSSGDMWYGFTMYFETPQSNNNWTGNSLGHFIQWHPNNGTGSASLSLWGGGKWDMAVNPSGGSSATHTPSAQQKTIRANVWYHVVMHVKWGSGGKAELWVNDTLIDSRSNLNWAGGEYLKFGMNRWNSNGGSPTTTWVIYYDNLKIGRNCTYNDVDPQPTSPTLPVRFIHELDANKNGSKVNLTWETAEEINFNRFIIERSSDGQNYSAIGTVYGNPNLKYSFTDHTPGITNYYRLRCIDIDSRYAFSRVVKCDFAFVKQRIMVYDIVGRLLLNKIQENPNIVAELREANLPKRSVYLVRWENGESKKIVLVE